MTLESWLKAYFISFVSSKPSIKFWLFYCKRSVGKRIIQHICANTFPCTPYCVRCISHNLKICGQHLSFQRKQYNYEPKFSSLSVTTRKFVCCNYGLFHSKSRPNQIKLFSLASKWLKCETLAKFECLLPSLLITSRSWWNKRLYIHCFHKG